MKMICICCPISCEMDVKVIKGKVIVKGNKCPRGEEYAKEEIISPKRTFTGIFKNRYGVFAVKTSAPIAKKMILKLAAMMKKMPDKNYDIGEIAIEKVLKQKANLIITGKTVN